MVHAVLLHPRTEVIEMCAHVASDVPLTSEPALAIRIFVAKVVSVPLMEERLGVMLVTCHVSVLQTQHRFRPRQNQDRQLRADAVALLHVAQLKQMMKSLCKRKQLRLLRSSDCSSKRWQRTAGMPMELPLGPC
jgi:hypothetical protein